MKGKVTLNTTNNIWENIILLMDKAAKPIEQMDQNIHDRLDNIRFRMQSNPSLRSLANRKQQLKGLSFNAAFLLQHCQLIW